MDYGDAILEKMPVNVLLQLGVVFEFRAVCLHGKGDSVMDSGLVKFDGWPHILRAQQFSREWSESVLFPLSNRMDKMLKAKCCRGLLSGKTMASVFVAESTRTRGSFETSIHKLGGTVSFSAPNAKLSSAMGKGEYFADTIRALGEYEPDVLVIRNDGEEKISDIARLLRVPVINAADNVVKDKQHPSQALLDLYTIFRYCGHIDGLSIAIVGDLLNGRAARSLIYMLAKWRIKHLYLVAPPEFQIDAVMEEHLREHGVNFTQCGDIREIANLVDVFYQTRTQNNLGSKAWQRTEETVINGRLLSTMKKQAIIMHPLPCTGEIIRAEVDDDNRAVYIAGKLGLPSQVRCGLLTRMAELLVVMEPDIAYALL